MKKIHLVIALAAIIIVAFAMADYSQYKQRESQITAVYEQKSQDTTINISSAVIQYAKLCHTKDMGNIIFQSTTTERAIISCAGTTYEHQ